MPVSNNYHVVEYEGNNSGRSFNFPFRCFSLEHLIVEHITIDENSGGESVKILLRNTEYSVSGGLGNDGGSIVYPLPAEAAALSPAEKIRIYRNTPLSQEIDYPTYQQAIENALDKAVMINQEVAEGSKGAKQAIADFDLRVEQAESSVANTLNIANNAVDIAQNAEVTARLADGSASIALANSAEAEEKADQAVITVNNAVEDVNYITEQMSVKADCDGSNIDPLRFLQNLGVDEEFNVNLMDLANTTGSNIDVSAFSIQLGLADLADTCASNIDVSSYRTQLGLADLANTTGTNVDVAAYKSALAPRVVTSLSGIDGNYTGEQILRISGVVDDPDNDMYFWDGVQWYKEGV